MRYIIVTLVVLQVACGGARADRAPSDDAGAGAPPAPVAAPAPAVTPAPAANPAAAAADPVGAGVKPFLDRLAAYVAVRAKVDDGIPRLKETSDPKQIADRERALADALIKARAGAKPGDVFAAEAQPVLARIIRDDFAKRTIAERKALILELPKGMKFGINQFYPTTIPLATFPANLLKALPELPPDIEYRIVHRHLILRDVRANYVIDIMPDVFPIPV